MVGDTRKKLAACRSARAALLAKLRESRARQAAAEAALVELVAAVDAHRDRTIAENAADWALYEVADRVR